MENIYINSCFITFLIIFGQAFFVLIKSKQITSAGSWFLTSVFLGILSWGLWGVSTATDSNQALFYRYVLNIGLIFLPVFYFRFVITLLKIKTEKFACLRLFFGISGLLIILNLIPGIRTTLYYFNSAFIYWPDLNPIYLLYLIFLISLFVYSFYLILARYEKSSGVVKNQIRYILPFSFLAFLGSIISFWPFLLDWLLIGNLLISLSVIVIAYALLKYPLPSGKRMASLVYTYVFIAVFSYLFFHLVSFVSIGYFGGIYSSKALAAGALFALLFALMFLPFLNYVQETGDILFFRGKNPYRIIKDLALKFNKTLEAKTLVKIITEEFKDILKAETVKIVIFNLKDKTVWEKYSNQGLKIRPNSPLTNIKSLKVLGRLKDSQESLRGQMEKNKINLAVPLIFKDELLGLVLLGEKFTHDGYTEEDLDFLEAIAPQIAIAWHNTLIFQELQDMNNNLEQKVKEKTADIQDKNNKLKKMLATQSEFLDVAGHQLRTPVSVIKGMLGMIIEDEINQKKKNEFLDSVLQNAFKLEEIIETMLIASEVDSGSFGFDLGPVQLEPLLNEIYERQKGRAKKKSLRFKIKTPNKYIMPVLSNERYLKQVLENLIDNAFQYSEKGEVIVKVRPNKDKIEIDVIDTGIGIPKKELGSLFEKFKRAQNAVNVYGNGSGLGLFVVKKIIDAHTKDAKVYIRESEMNKGTTFTVSLPTVREI